MAYQIVLSQQTPGWFIIGLLWPRLYNRQVSGLDSATKVPIVIFVYILLDRQGISRQSFTLNPAALIKIL